MSSLFEGWITRLKVSWMGPAAQRIFGGFAAALADKSYDWALQGVLEHLPFTASAPSLPLIASERQLETALGEAATSLAAREPYASFIHKLDGTALRLLVGLHFIGFDGAIVLQQNGRQYSLTLPLPAFGGTGWDPTPNLVVADSGPPLAAPLSSPTPGKAPVPAGTPWYALDNNPDLANRFAVILPSGSWSYSGLAQAVFNNSDAATVTWPAGLGTSYTVIYGPPTDAVELWVDGTSKTPTGCTLRASGPWTGSVWVIGFISGSSPFNFVSLEAVSLIQAVIKLCRPEKAYCAGVFAIQSGRMWDYFPGGTTWDGGTYPTWDTSSVLQILGGF